MPQTNSPSPATAGNHIGHRGLIATAIILTVIILDQILKIWVKTHFYLNEDLEITSWFHLHFIENNGMAFGMEFGPKIFLTIFRLVLAAGLIWVLVRIKAMAAVKTGFLVCLALIIAGAIGNIIDCVFYGVIFNNPMPPEVAQMFPPGADMPLSSTDAWSICSISLCSLSHGRDGCPEWGDRSFSSSSRYSIWPTPLFHAA